MVSGQLSECTQNVRTWVTSTQVKRANRSGSSHGNSHHSPPSPPQRWLCLGFNTEAYFAWFWT